VGVVAGSVIGFAYVVPLSVGMQWFPRQKGLITGLSVGGFGGGAIILSSIIEAGKLSGLSLDRFFLLYSLVSGSLLFLAALLLSSPPATTGKKSGEMQVHKAHSEKPMVLSILGMFSGTFAGLLLVGNLAPYALSKGLAEEMTVLSVVLFSLGNLSGRIIWGHIFDRTGYRVIPWSLLLASLFYVLVGVSSGGFIFLASVLVLGFLFGSQFVLYAGYLSKTYGVTAFSKRYPLVFLSYGLAGIIAPGIGGWIADTTGSYNTAIMVCLVLLSVSGLVLITANRKR
jgi:OFA family oxalate/formate antiporter-like MFS transporter